MKHLWCEDGDRAIKRLLNRRSLYAFDFDGTLASIALDPDEVQLSAESANLIRTLAERVPVAIVSGRSLTDLRSKLASDVIYFVGNHGAEGLPGVKDDHSLRETCRIWLKQIEPWNRGWPDEYKISVEDKGLSLSLHFREARDTLEVERFLIDRMEQLKPVPRVVRGKCILNLSPQESTHKGDAVLRLISHFNCEQALFVGDDVTDESVFELRDERVLGVHVGEREHSQASFFLKDQSEVFGLIARLVAETA